MVAKQRKPFVLNLFLIIVLLGMIFGIIPAQATGALFASNSIEPVPLPLPVGWIEASLVDVWGSSARDVYAVGYGRQGDMPRVPLVYHNDGAVWTEASPSLPAGWNYAQLYGVWGSSAGNVFAVGEGSGITVPGAPLLYYNNGKSWTHIPLSLPVGWSYGSLSGVWGSSANDIYAVGWGKDATGVNTSLLYHSDGTT